jgi:predicted RNA binding protein YcfA (HicA-like mRNA interferase family)
VTEYPAVGSREVKRALTRAGWEARPGKGHTVFSKGRRTVVVDDDVKRFSAKLLGLMRRQTGLGRDRFIGLLRGEEPG